MMCLCIFGVWKVDKLVDVAHDGHLGADVDHVGVVRVVGLADHVDVVLVRPWNL